MTIARRFSVGSFILSVIIGLGSVMAAQDATRAYPIGALLRGIPREKGSAGGALRPGGTGEVARAAIYGEELEPIEGLDAAGLQDILLSHVKRDVSESDAFRLEVFGDTLIVHAPEATHAGLRAALVGIEAHHFRRLRVEILRLPAAAFQHAQGSLLTKANVDDLLRAVTPVTRERALMLHGERRCFTSVRHRAVVKDADVEVSQDAGVADPLIDVMTYGDELELDAQQCADGRVLVTVSVRVTDERAPPRVLQPGKLVGPLELVSTDTRVAYASGIVENGGGLLLGSTDDITSTWLVRIASEASEVAVEIGDFETLLPLGSLHQAPVGGMSLPSTVNPSGIGGGIERFDSGLPPELRRDSLNAGIPGLVTSHTAGKVESTAFLGGVSLVGERKDREVARRAIVALSRDHAPNVSFQVAAGLVDADDLEEVDRIANGWPALKHRAFLSARCDDTCGVEIGDEQFYLKDYDIEISSSAVMGDPVTDTLFRGTVLSITPRRVGQAMLIEGSALCQTDANPMRTLVMNVNGDAPVELPDLVRTAGKYRSELTNGEWVEIFRRARPTDGKLFIVKVRGVY